VTASVSVELPRLAQRLRQLRDKYFVGRSAEIEAFRSALHSDITERPVALFFVHGPGGVGKSVLLRQFRRTAEAAHARVAHLDGRDIEASPAGFLAALRTQLDISPETSPIDALAGESRPVLLVDTYEVLTPLDTWLRELFLPQLPDQALVVLSGRRPPSAGWRADPAWSELAHVLPLRNLHPSDSRAYLQARGLPPAQHDSVLAFTHGHPLALSLLANLLLADQSRAFRPEHAPDVVRTLLEQFVERVPSQSHWRALAVCAHARMTTEALLAEVIDAAQAPALFAWLRDLPFVEQGAQGLFPHDIAREVLEADLRWRDPMSYRELHAGIRDVLVARLRTSRALEQQSAYFDFLYLARHGFISRAFYDWASFGHMYAEVAVEADHATIIDLTRRHEGDDSARIAEYWLGRQPRSFVVFREASQQIAGFATPLLLEEPNAEDMASDSAIAAVWPFIARHGPPRHGERIMYHRFFVGRDAYQDVVIHNMVGMLATMRWLTTPRLAWSFPVVAEGPRWEPLFTSIRFARSPEADFEVGGRRYATFAHDWRLDPIERWIEVKTALDPNDEAVQAASGDAPPLEVLSQPDFEAAVRQALRDLHRPTLASNPLLRSRLAYAHARGAPSPATLRALISRPRRSCALTSAAERTSCIARWTAPTCRRPRRRSWPPSDSACRSTRTATSWPRPSSASPRRSGTASCKRRSIECRVTRWFSLRRHSSVRAAGWLPICGEIH
jgi:AAA ATPase domain